MSFETEFKELFERKYFIKITMGCVSVLAICVTMTGVVMSIKLVVLG